MTDRSVCGPILAASQTRNKRLVADKLCANYCANNHWERLDDLIGYLTFRRIAFRRTALQRMSLRVIFVKSPEGVSPSVISPNVKSPDANLPIGSIFEMSSFHLPSISSSLSLHSSASGSPCFRLGIILPRPALP